MTFPCCAFRRSFRIYLCSCSVCVCTSLPDSKVSEVVRAGTEEIKEIPAFSRQSMPTTVESIDDGRSSNKFSSIIMSN
ncbi:hypothetical protein F4782DRAFT_503432 [Xylaria castorea]|nr:hypothetical protein F4782DRAFT_503432 [Xylaria castorea]